MSNFDFEDSWWVPRSVDELIKLTSYFPKYGKYAKEPDFEGNNVVADLPWAINMPPLSVPDFHIPLKDGAMQRFKQLNKKILVFAKKGELPPDDLILAAFNCIDQSKKSTPNIRYLFDKYILQLENVEEPE